MNIKKNGFTLIELLVVIAIVGILSGIVVVQMSSAADAARDGVRKADIANLRKALLAYSILNNNTYPTANCSSINSCAALSSALIPTYMSIFPTDPNGTNYSYVSAAGTSFKVSATLSTGYSYQYDSSTNAFSTNTPLAGACGSKNGKYATTAPAGAEACAIGTVTGMTGTYSWTCVNVGVSSGTCATVATATYAVQSFTTVGTSDWTVPAGVYSVEYLVVAGGGAGGMTATGDTGSGGGAGGILSGSVSVTPSAVLHVTVGSGGIGRNTKGGDSSFSAVGEVAEGGGGGSGVSDSTVGNGGSSGGSNGHISAPTPLHPGQGNIGGGLYYSQDWSAAGGGGAGGPGTANSGYGHDSIAGLGGIGRISSITGSAVVYGGGGGGAAGDNHGGGAGGSGIGGHGHQSAAYTGPVVLATDGVANTGSGGGGGGNSNVGNGGSGIVILKYINNY
jgi:type II secretion system protein G